MNHKNIEKLMSIIDKLSEDNDEISLEELEKEAEKQGIDDPSYLVKEMISQGLIIDLGNNKIQKIAKRLFW